MGKVSQLKVGNHYLYITSFCTTSKEPPHIHSHRSRATSERGSGKIWVNLDGTSVIENTGGAKDFELREIQKWIPDNLAKIEAEWEKLGGRWIIFSKD
jgi:hypothetical protein